MELGFTEAAQCLADLGHVVGARVRALLAVLGDGCEGLPEDVEAAARASRCLSRPIR